ncbi:MAG TPA: DUF3341 domain-containing protein [Vicinamibacterales bacterium]|nr:DUF3341 domain-containing protein [Vicinamibacterales bacterium]
MARRRWMVAEFDSADRLRDAVRRLRERGARIEEACTPYEVPGLSSLMGKRKTRIPTIAFIGGLAGALIGYGIEWYTNVIDYPLDAGGRPTHAVPSFIFITFETLVLCAALSIFFGVFVLLGLPRYYHPLWEVPGFERASVDRFWVVVERDGDADVFEGLEPLRVVDLEVDR